MRKDNVNSRQIQKKKIHCVMMERICQILNSFTTNLIVRKVDTFECLREKMKIRTRNIKRERLTSLLIKTLARSWTPSSPILFELRSIVIRVYVRKVKIQIAEKKRRGTHLVIQDGISQVLDPSMPDMIIRNVQCGEHLCEKMKMQTRPIKKESIFTVACRMTSARS